MPKPKEKTSDTDTVQQPKNEFLDWLDDPVQEFEIPELPNSEKEPVFDPFEIIEEETESKKPKTEKESFGMASKYIRLLDKGFSGMAAAYSSGNVKDYKIDTDDQNDLAEPLAEIIATNDFLDLPPGWALAITALIIYSPLVMKAVGERRDHKLIEEKEAEKKIVKATVAADTNEKDTE